jgi:hypothetical protein
MPKIMAAVVMMIGRIRTRPACSSASGTERPARRPWLAKSTSRMAFLVTRPISITSPIIENRFSVERVTRSASITPISASGSDAMIASGCRKLENCEARTM